MANDNGRAISKHPYMYWLQWASLPLDFVFFLILFRFGPALAYSEDDSLIFIWLFLLFTPLTVDVVYFYFYSKVQDLAIKMLPPLLAGTLAVEFTSGGWSDSIIKGNWGRILYLITEVPETIVEIFLILLIPFFVASMIKKLLGKKGTLPFI